MREDKFKILNFIKLRGPLLPIQVSKEINVNTIFAGALLSELVRDKKVRITSLKCGGSPFYYVDGQELRLQQLMHYLPKKEQEMVEILRDRKVVREKDLKPWQRVALREIKDFSFPLDVKIDSGIERFWKWYLLSDEEAKVLIENMLDVRKETKSSRLVEVETQDKLKINGKERVKSGEVSDFYNMFKSYFSRNRIIIEKENIVRKNREFNFVIVVPSNIGDLKYYVKAKNKKVINDADLSLAYSEGQDFKLPVMFLTNGKLTKKAKDYAEKKLKGRLIFKHV